MTISTLDIYVDPVHQMILIDHISKTSFRDTWNLPLSTLYLPLKRNTFLQDTFLLTYFLWGPLSIYHSLHLFYTISNDNTFLQDTFLCHISPQDPDPSIFHFISSTWYLMTVFPNIIPWLTWIITNAIMTLNPWPPNLALIHSPFIVCIFLLGALALSTLHREIMPLRIALTCASWCHFGICQSGERRMNGLWYTVAVGYQIKA